MPSANRIPRPLQNIQEGVMPPALHGIHAHAVHFRDGGVNGRIGWRAVLVLLGGEGDAAFGGRGRRGEVVGVIEAQAPVAEIAADDEDVGFVAEVRGEEGAVGAFGGGGGGAHENGGEERRRGFWGRGGEGEEVGDVGEVHLEAVLGFIGGEGEGRELSGGAQGGEGGGVES